MAGNEIKLNICYGCMRKLEEGQQVCPVCGYDSNAPHNGEDVLPEGTVLFRKYLIGRVLGRGGFGVTYLGYDLDLQLKVAIKEYFPIGVCVRSSQSYNVITASAIEDHTIFSRGCEVFLDEARTLAKFNNPYIVHVRDFFREHGTAYIVMDYVDGITLRAEMKRNGGKLPYERVLTLMKPLIQQLDRLHQRNVIHRDIKPENMMLLDDENGEHLVLLDFGSARTYVSNESRTMTGIVTAGYSPLEQYSQKSRQGAYTDVYALCATMYHAITGVLPPASIERNVDDTPLKSFAECGVIAPKTVEQAIMHGLALKSTERTQTMGELLEELKGEDTAEFGEDKRNEQKAEHVSEAKTDEVTQKSRLEKQRETSSTQTGAGAQGKNEKKSSVLPKVLAGVVAGVLLVIGIYFGFLRDAEKAEVKPGTPEETAVVSSTPAPTHSPIISKEDLPAFKTVGSIVTFGTYEQDNNATNGKEDIEWIVLANEGDRSLLISRYGLDCRQYNTEWTDVTWEECSLREWLNKEFLSSAFNSKERKMIPLVNVSADKNPKYDTDPGKATQDRVFLLSISEANGYFEWNRDRKCTPTENAVKNGCSVNQNGETCWWWLRSPGHNRLSAAYVNLDGSLGNSIRVRSDSGAVRPALWIDLKSGIF